MSRQSEDALMMAAIVFLIFLVVGMLIRTFPG